MVRFWPFKGDDTSAASFEKTLSSLSSKITESTNKLESQRQTSRRFKALWTLYTSVLYLIYATILAVAVGWKKWTLVQYAALVGGPFSIYAIRLAITRFYEYKISSTQSNLSSLQKQRDATIEKLKEATKYNSTQQLLEKYSGTTPRPTPSKGQGQDQQKRKPLPQSTSTQRTGFPPPPTANIPGRSVQISAPISPVPVHPQQQPASPQTIPSPEDIASFAPNAFNAPLEYSSQPNFHPTWSDRLLDLLLGEDESAPKNRIVLLCEHCRLVNGQAPPGVKSLDQLGKWRCRGCGGWNGENNEARRLVEVMRRNREQGEQEGWKDISKGDEEMDTESKWKSEGEDIVGLNDSDRRDQVEDTLELSEESSEADSDEVEEPPGAKIKSKGKDSRKNGQ